MQLAVLQRLVCRVLAIAAPGADEIRWDKAPCRFCGTGCSVLVGTKEGRIVATQGDLRRRLIVA